MSAGRKALVVATYRYADGGLSQLAAPEHDAEAFAAVLEDPEIAGFDVTMLVNEPHHVVGEAIADFYGDCRRDDLTLLYFSGHGLKDDEGRLHLAMTNTRREALMFTAISAAQLNEAMDACASRRKVLILDCCYSGAFPAGRTAKSDEGVQTLERFQGKGRAVLTASDATQYAFEGDDVRGSGTSSVFTRYLVEAIRSGEADLDEDGDIALDELYSYVREKVVAEVPQQRPKKQEDVDGRILIARNVHWTLPAHLQHALESPISAQRLSAVEGLAHLHRVGNEVVRATVAGHVAVLADDDSRAVSAAATALQESIAARGASSAGTGRVPPPRVPSETPQLPAATAPAASAPRSPAARAGPRPPAPPGPPVGSTRTQPVPAAAEPERARGPQVTVGPPIAAVLALIVAGAVLLVVSRVVVFESVNGETAGDYGISATAWVLGVAAPLVGALLLFIAWGGAPWTGPLAVGLVLGAAFSGIEQTLGTVALFVYSDGSDAPGLGWWLSIAGTALLLGCVAVAREAVFDLRARVRRDGRALVAVGLVVVALVAWLQAFDGFYIWFAGVEPGLLLATLCLPLTALELSARQRTAGLAAVTVFGVWLVASGLHAFAVDTFVHDARSTGTGLVCTLVSVGACYLAQIGPPRPRPVTPTVVAPPR